MNRIVKTAAMLGAALVFSEARATPCPAATVKDPESDEWSNRVIAALIGADACYADRSAFTNSDCNIFAGRVLEQAYGVKDFVLPKPQDGRRYQISNDIALQLWTTLIDQWELLGTLTDQAALDMARIRAKRKPVIAVWKNPDDKKPGHIALVGPGPMTHSGTLGRDTPVSASFFQGRPADNYVGKPLACAFTSAQAPAVRLYARK